MIQVDVIDRNGEQHKLEAPTDMNLNLMELCQSAGLPVKGTCGGMALCASCHCYIKSNHELPKQTPEEEDMLDQTFFIENNSRLGCQIQLKETINHLKVELAPESD